ncbi:HNH endonuclease [Clostridium septicum]|uniref:HNH endonuclease n=1 Tax=Clostridium septicum TaxID=1504 RepID=UPI00272E66A2|nr:HNH endonuclease [Clostridium septicum]WLF70486.1 HNH endonuclease [Clostridium septicum]
MRKEHIFKDGIEYKECSSCKRILTLDKYSKNKPSWDNLKSYCKECAYCGRSLKKLTQDHLIPLSKGGNYTKNNIIPVCRNCNSKKHTKDFFTWYKEQNFYSKERENKIVKYISTFK